MSFQAMAWAVNTKVGNATGKSILMILANYVDDNNQCFPSQKRIAENCDCSVRTVATWLEKFEAMGMITREKRQREDGSRTSDFITLIQHAGNADRPQSNMQDIPIQHAGGADHEPITYPITKNISRFSEFWEAFADKRGKDAAQRVWKRKHLDKIADEVIAGAKAYAGSRPKEREFWKMAQGWLNDGRWQDQTSTTGKVLTDEDKARLRAQIPSKLIKTKPSKFLVEFAKRKAAANG